MPTGGRWGGGVIGLPGAGAPGVACAGGRPGGGAVGLGRPGSKVPGGGAAGAAGRETSAPGEGRGCLGPVRIWPGLGGGTGLAGMAMVRGVGAGTAGEGAGVTGASRGTGGAAKGPANGGRRGVTDRGVNLSSAGAGASVTTGVGGSTSTGIVFSTGSSGAPEISGSDSRTDSSEGGSSTAVPT